MPTPFPGMDPYLEQSGIWNQIHTDLIVYIRRHLTSLLRPRYVVAIEQRTFAETSDQSVSIGRPDVLAVLPPSPAPVAAPMAAVAVPVLAEVREAYRVRLPMPDEVFERYLEVRDRVSGEAITLIEILSPSNKRSHRLEYLEKRMEILGSETNLVEIDLLRAGLPMPMTGKTPTTHYRILVSRAWERPYAQALLFNIQQPIPDTPIPLRQGEAEPALPLNQLLHEIYDEGGYDLMVDYRRPPETPLDSATEEWAARLLAAV
ncbi:MAG: DUF4058 family protein [Caldilineaceae bacterium]|nr:DUF4058 family protein [Caldilineaceae bacterium]